MKLDSVMTKMIILPYNLDFQLYVGMIKYLD